MEESEVQGGRDREMEGLGWEVGRRGRGWAQRPWQVPMGTETLGGKG